MCLAEDIAAFQDQYGVKKPPVMAHNSSSCFGYRIDCCAVPIDLLSEEHDPIAPVGGLHKMVASYPDKMTLHVIRDAGYMLFLGSTEAVIEILK